MRLLLIYAAACTAFFAVCDASGLPLQSKVHERRGDVPVPPPVPLGYHPQSGPFIVHLSDDGQIDIGQFGVIAQAVRNWSGPNLQAFSICFRSATPDGDWQLASRSLKIVATELKARGALIVVEPDGLLCDAGSPRSTQSHGSYVTIMGVFRA